MDSLAEQFCGVTDSDMETARRFLQMSDSNLQTAIDLFFVQHSADNSKPSTSSSSSTVRAPIPQKSSVLVGESFQASYTSVKRQNVNSVFDTFRDFQAETIEQTRLIKEAAQGIGIINGPSTSTESSTEAPNEALKRKTLESLFRPPLEMMHRGTFETAKQEAVKKKSWLLVNVQNVSEFSCQALNRDIWNHRMVKDLITENFIFWQIYFDSSEGNRFCTYYPVETYPFVCAIDPVTGELIKTFRNITDTLAFCDSIVNFLETHTNPMNYGAVPKNAHTNSNSTSPDKVLDGNVKSSLKRKIPAGITQQYPSSKSSKMDDSPAINHSMNNGFPVDSPQNLQSQQDDNQSSQIWSDFTATSGEELQLMFRLPNGKKHILKIYSHSKLKAILLYAQTELCLPASTYNYVLNHPRRILNDLDAMRNLHNLNMNKQELIYIEQR